MSIEDYEKLHAELDKIPENKKLLLLDVNKQLGNQDANGVKQNNRRIIKYKLFGINIQFNYITSYYISDPMPMESINQN